MKKKYILLLALMMGCSKGKEKVSEMRLESKGFFKDLLKDDYSKLTDCIENGSVGEFETLLAKKPEIALKGPILIKIIRSKKLDDEMKLRFINVVLWLDYQNPKLANSVGIKTLLNMRGNMHDVRDKCEDPKGRKIEVTPFIAATLTSIKIARKLLLFAGSEMLDINAQDSMGKTALMYSIIHNNINLTKELLSGKFPIEVSIADKDGNTALAFAALKDGVKLNTEAVEALLKKGADINAKNNDGLTALNFAINSGYKLDEFIFFLLDKGADVNLADKEGETPLIKAVKNGNQDLVRRLLLEKNINLNAKDSYGRSAIFYACITGNEAIADKLISRANIFEVDNNEETLLMYAVRYKNEFFFRNLLRRISKEDINKQDKDGKTALIKAVELQGWNYDKRLIVGALIFEAGADRFLSDKSGKNALMYIVSSPSIDRATGIGFVNFFLYDDLEEGKEFELSTMRSIINAKDKDSLTALMIALKEGNTDFAREIINRGRYALDIKLQDNEGKTTLMYALLSRCKDGCLECRDVKNNLGTVRCRLVRNLVTNILRIEHGGDKEHLDMQDESGKTYLMHAISSKWSEGDIINLLMPAASDLNLQDAEGNTILMYAIRNKALSLVREIVNLGADCNLKNKAGFTALDIAKAMDKDCEGTDPKIEEIVKKLEEQVR